MPYAEALWNLNLRHLRALSATTRLGSISAAAQSVAISQPAITQALAKLEADLGHTFFERRSDGMKPTEALGAVAGLKVAGIQKSLGGLSAAASAESQVKKDEAAVAYKKAVSLGAAADPSMESLLAE